MISKKINHDIWGNAAKLMPKLLDTVDDKIGLAKQFIDTLWTAASDEYDSETLAIYTNAVSNIIKQSPEFMDVTAVNSICLTCIEMLK